MIVIRSFFLIYSKAILDEEDEESLHSDNSGSQSSEENIHENSEEEDTFDFEEEEVRIKRKVRSNRILILFSYGSL